MDHDPGQTLSYDTWEIMPLSLVSDVQSSISLIISHSCTEVNITCNSSNLVYRGGVTWYVSLAYRGQYHLLSLTGVQRSVSRTVVDRDQWQESQDQTLSDW